jgi:hypothetical protein
MLKRFIGILPESIILSCRGAKAFVRAFYKKEAIPIFRQAPGCQVTPVNRNSFSQLKLLLDFLLCGRDTSPQYLWLHWPATLTLLAAEGC